jgi:hypothetical protein
MSAFDHKKKDSASYMKPRASHMKLNEEQMYCLSFFHWPRISSYSFYCTAYVCGYWLAITDQAKYMKLHNDEEMYCLFCFLRFLHWPRKSATQPPRPRSMAAVKPCETQWKPSALVNDGYDLSKPTAALHKYSIVDAMATSQQDCAGDPACSSPQLWINDIGLRTA